MFWHSGEVIQVIVLSLRAPNLSPRLWVRKASIGLSQVPQCSINGRELTCCVKRFRGHIPAWYRRMQSSVSGVTISCNGKGHHANICHNCLRAPDKCGLHLQPESLHTFSLLVVYFIPPVPWYETWGHLLLYRCCRPVISYWVSPYELNTQAIPVTGYQNS